MRAGIEIAWNPKEWRNTLKHGFEGLDVVGWQAELIAYGSQLTDVVGVFGDSTHNATINFQMVYGLEMDGVVGPKTRAKIGLRPELPEPPAFSKLPTNIPFIEAKHWSRHIKPRDQVLNIIIHSMETPETDTRAEVCAGNFAAGARKASCHFCVDCDSVVQCVAEDRIAWHAPGRNRRGLGIEHAGRARQTRLQWLDSFSKRMLELSAQLTARLCIKWKLPAVFVGFEGLRLKHPGITTHAEVSKAFGKSSHYDPGAEFPMDYYLDRVKHYMDGG
jgi:N-acetyl-anhydromuramyl-L-alanine amidase AmpD